jgi:hypothetical protein
VQQVRRGRDGAGLLLRLRVAGGDNEPVKVGEILELSIWADGHETTEMVAQFYSDVQEAVRQCAERNQLVFAPVQFFEKKPGEDRVPPVPKHVQGPNVRLIVAEALAIGERQVRLTSFLNDLDPIDLKRLRLITRRVHYGLNPDGTKRRLTDAEVDRVIEEYGPQAAADVIRSGMQSGMVH